MFQSIPQVPHLASPGSAPSVSRPIFDGVSETGGKVDRAVIDRLVVKGFTTIEMISLLLGGDSDMEMCFGFNIAAISMQKRNEAYYNTRPRRVVCDRAHRSGKISEKFQEQSHTYVASQGKWSVAVPKDHLKPLVKAMAMVGNVPVSSSVGEKPDTYFLQGGSVSCRLGPFLVALQKCNIPLAEFVFAQIGEVTDVHLRERAEGVDPDGDILARSGLEIDEEKFLSTPRGRALDLILQQAPFTCTTSADEADTIVYESSMLSMDLKCVSTTSDQGVPLFGVAKTKGAGVCSSRVYPTASAAQFLIMAAECRRTRKSAAHVVQFEAQMTFAGTVRFYHRTNLQHKHPAPHDTQRCRGLQYRSELELAWRKGHPGGEPMDPHFNLGTEVVPGDMDLCTSDVYLHDNTTGAKNDLKQFKIMKQAVGTDDSVGVDAKTARNLARTVQKLDAGIRADPELSALVTRTSFEASFIVRARPGLGIVAVLKEGFRRMDGVIPSLQRFDFPLDQYRRYQELLSDYACNSSVLAGRVTTVSRDALSEAGSACMQTILNARGIVPYTAQAADSRHPSDKGVLKMLAKSSVDSLSYLDHTPAEVVLILQPIQK